MDGSPQRFERVGPSTVCYFAAATSGADLSSVFPPASAALRVRLECRTQRCVPRLAVCHGLRCRRKRPEGWFCTVCVRRRCVRDGACVCSCVCLCPSACVCVRDCVRVCLIDCDLVPTTAGRAHSASVSCTVPLAQGRPSPEGGAAAGSSLPRPRRRASLRPGSRGGLSRAQWHGARGRG